MEKEIQYKGKKLTYFDLGSGPVVVLLHGFGEDANIWKDQVRHLQKKFRVITPHLPGSGTSEIIEDMSMEGIAESLHFLLQQEGISKCVLIGHSMGGYITLAFAERHSEMLSGFGLFHSTAYADTAEKKETRKKGIEFIKLHGAAAFLKTATPNLYSNITKEEKGEVIENHIQSVNYFSKDALIKYYEGMMGRSDRTHVLKQNKLPFLIVLGKEDAVVPLKDGLAQSYLPVVSHVHILQKSAHMGMVEEAEETNTLIAEYLQSIFKE